MSEIRYDLPSVSRVIRTASSDARLSMLLVLLYSGPTRYVELQRKIGLSSKTLSGKFAYHLRGLQRVRLICKVRPGMWDLTEEGRIFATLVESLISPSPLLLRAARLGPNIIRAARKAEESAQAFHSLMSADIRPLNRKAMFSAPRVKLAEADVAALNEPERIRKKVQAAERQWPSAEVYISNERH